MSLINKKIISVLILFGGTAWIFLNIFFTPFYIWSEGVYHPWLLLNGFVMFRDSVWDRASFDLYALAGFYKIFGLSLLNFQIFIFLSQAIIGILMFLLLYKKSFLLTTASYVIYCILAFLVYGTVNQPAEILLGLLTFLTFLFFWEYVEKKDIKFLFFAGLTTGFSLITKQTSLFIFVSTLLLLFIFSKKNLKNTLFAFLLGSAFPVLVYAGYFALNNGLYDLYFSTIYMPLVPYRQSAPIGDLQEGIRILGLHLAIIIPFLFVKIKIIPKPVKVSLILFILSLIPTLLPSFWSYRLISALPLFSVMISAFLIWGYTILKERKNYLMKGIFTFGVIAFLVQFGSYFTQSTQYVSDNGGFVWRKYQMDGYSENEIGVSEWLRNNTAKNERVFNMANNLVLFYSNRYPQNKYDASMSFGLYPISQYFDAITKNPARVVIYDSNLPKDWDLLKDWEYAKFLKNHYTLAKAFGQYEIYILNKDFIK